jgi:hypothetical protein
MAGENVGGGLSPEEARIQQAADQTFHVLEGVEGAVPSARNRFFENLRQVTVEAPLHSLAVAFLLGVILSWRL